MSRRVYEIVKEHCLEKYSRFGLQPLHTACAIGNWSEIEKYLDSTNFDKVIDAESPLWAGVTPLLIAAKFRQMPVVTKLLDLGASPRVRDCEKNTPLHYLSTYGLYDKRLFIYEDEDTFGHLNGASHFHIACQFCPSTIDVVKIYLEKGMSPDLRGKKNYYIGDYEHIKDTTGLMIAGMTVLRYEDGSAITERCPELAELLIEYEADIDMERDEWTALRFCSELTNDLLKDTQYICLLIESGANSENVDLSNFVESISKRKNTSMRLMFLRSIKKLLVLNESLVSLKLNEYYQKLLRKSPKFDESSYYQLCLKELDDISKLGLRHQLEADVIVWHNYRAKFGNVFRSPELLANFPIYGRLLKIRVKRRLIAFEKKKEKVWEAMPHITSLVRQFCNLPTLCTQEILWNFSYTELDSLIKMFS